MAVSFRLQEGQETIAHREGLNHTPRCSKILQFSTADSP